MRCGLPAENRPRFASTKNVEICAASNLQAAFGERPPRGWTGLIDNRWAETIGVPRLVSWLRLSGGPCPGSTLASWTPRSRS
jgi:hypothetical protein